MQPGRSPSETTQGTQPPSTQLEEVEDDVPLDEEADEEADFGATGGDAHAATFGSPAFALTTAFLFLRALVAVAFFSGSDVQPSGNRALSISASGGISLNFGLYL